uniref:Tubulin epsilon and delta complex protein 1 domain-containing protein n=1 Tax=Timema genevievae TaxID=629358 RepID=A0A7R9K7T1_TIMGE|nr:unnamed protein product [Timema genevievae]
MSVVAECLPICKQTGIHYPLPHTKPTSIGNSAKVLLLWRLLHKLIIVTKYYGHLVSVGDGVTHAKLTLAAMDYDCPEFYCLPVNMDAGSRELLLAIAWLLANKNILDVLYQTKLQNFVQEMDFDSGKLPNQAVYIHPTLQLVVHFTPLHLSAVRTDSEIYRLRYTRPSPPLPPERASSTQPTWRRLGRGSIYSTQLKAWYQNAPA